MFVRFLPLLFLPVLAACLEPARSPTPGGACRPEFEAPVLNACEGGGRVELAFVGDVLLHRQLQQLGYDRGFGPIWAQAVPFLARADLAVANLEGPVARGIDLHNREGADPGPVTGSVYTGYPRFNYHPDMLPALRAAGIDIVTTANNHAMDRGARGADLTLRAVAAAGLDAVGSVPGEGRGDFVLRKRTRAGVISFIACSFSTNDIPDPRRQILLCYRDRAALLALIAREAADPGVAGVVVLPHWGIEYSLAPAAQERRLARDLVAAGALAVVGTHPHAVQPFELVERPGGGVAPVVYSTGNFVAQQPFHPARIGAMAVLNLCRGTGGLAVERAGWIAMQMEFTRQGYYLSIAPKSATGPEAAAYALLNRVAPGFSAQPASCDP